jgi:predicted phage-related endonuclease
MKCEIIKYTTEEAWLAERMKDLTSSDIPVLFNCGYISMSELIDNKTTKILTRFESNERMDWGVALQDGIAHEFARQNQWNIRKKTEYIRIPELRIGSSFDFEIKIGVQILNEGFPSENALLEIKNVDAFEFRSKWVTSGFDIESTPYIELQVQHQMLVSGLKVAYIGALVGGNKGVIIRRESNKKVQDEILRRSEKFWKEVGK